MRIRKKIFLIESKLQLRYLRLIALSLMLPTLIVGGCLYYLIFSLLARAIAIPEFIAQVLFPVLGKINTILLFGLPLIFIVLFWTGVAISHRLAGPIDRLRKDMDDIIVEGNYSRRVRLRKDDDLKPIADDINKLLDKIGR